MITRKPTHPGEVLLEDVIKPLGLTVTEAAKNLGVSRKTLSELVNQKAALSRRMFLSSLNKGPVESEGFSAKAPRPQPTLGRYKGFYFLPISRLSGCNPQIVSSLKIQPQFSRCVECFRKPEGHIRCDRASLVGDFRQSLS